MAVYLVTGCAGFIGAKVTEFLLHDDHTVVGIDNLNDAYDVRLKQWRLKQLSGKSGFEFHRLDICEREELQRIFSEQSKKNDKSSAEVGNSRSFSGFDAVINLAARAGVRQSVEDPWIYLDTNVTGTLNLLELCHKYGVSKFVLASSSSLYGKDNPMPYREGADTDHPISPYAASKKAAETLCHTYHFLYDLDVTVFRYFTVYGPAGRPDMMPFRMVQWISESRPVTVFGDGQQSRDFTYVDDIARGTIAGLRPLGYEVINLGSDMPVVLMDAIRLVEGMIGRQAVLDSQPRHPADVVATWADIGRAERLLDWRPVVQMEEGLIRLVNWYQQNREWAGQVKTV